MDLAEIRKKARKQGKTGPSPVTPGVEAWPQPSAAAKSTGRPPEPNHLPRAAAPAADPLDALFSAPLEMELATEENYLQARQKTAEEETDQVQLLCFSLGREEYALDIESIREIIKPREVTEIPRVPDFILGIISLRGIIIPVYDLKRRLKLGRTEIAPASRIIVCQREERVVGLLVDCISQVVRLPTTGIEPPPAVLSGLDREMVEGVGRIQKKMIILLNLPCVIDAELI